MNVAVGGSKEDEDLNGRAGKVLKVPLDVGRVAGAGDGHIGGEEIAKLAVLQNITAVQFDDLPDAVDAELPFSVPKMAMGL